MAVTLLLAAAWACGAGGGAGSIDGGAARDGGEAQDGGAVRDGGAGATDGGAGATDGGAGATDGGLDAGLSADGGPLTFNSWIGGPCDSDDDCNLTGGKCLVGPSFPGGACSAPCTQFCPDRAGDPVSFCVSDPLALTGAPARCVSRCDYDLFPNGCREGYACVLSSRAGDDATHQSVCLAVDAPPGGSPLPWASFSGGRQALVTLATAPYPHASRLNGFTSSSGVYYPYAGHYDDSHVYIEVPDGFVDTGAVDLAFHYHGFNNAIYTVVDEYQLRTQFFASRRNGVLVIVQGPKNAPDNGIGKVEESGGFRNLVTEVAGLLYGDGLISHHRVGRVAITSHSGGYTASALSLDIGLIRPHVSECYLFDSFYGDYDQFFRYATETDGRLISITTSYLDSANSNFEARLAAANVPYATSLDGGARLTFLHTNVPHDSVPLGNYQLFFESGRFDPIP
jgi:hypothetical protein